jgi:hypothetical protein
MCKPCRPTLKIPNNVTFAEYLHAKNFVTTRALDLPAPTPQLQLEKGAPLAAVPPAVAPATVTIEGKEFDVYVADFAHVHGSTIPVFLVNVSIFDEEPSHSPSLVGEPSHSPDPS